MSMAAPPSAALSAVTSHSHFQRRSQHGGHRKAGSDRTLFITALVSGQAR